MTTLFLHDSSNSQGRSRKTEAVHYQIDCDLMITRGTEISIMRCLDILHFSTSGFPSIPAMTAIRFVARLSWLVKRISALVIALGPSEGIFNVEENEWSKSGLWLVRTFPE